MRIGDAAAIAVGSWAVWGLVSLAGCGGGADAGAQQSPDSGGGVSSPDTADAAGAGDGGDPGAASAVPCDPDAGDVTQTCGADQACCAGWCVDLAKDARNCGACGNACGATQFCTSKACVEAQVASLCANANATAVLDPYPIDNSAGSVVGAALAAACNPAVATSAEGQDGGGLLDPSTGRPLVGPGDTLLFGGGIFAQRALQYLDSAGLTRVYYDNDGSNAWLVDRQTGAKVVTTSMALETAHHDYFLLQITVEPMSGTLCFAAFGMQAPGTTAAAFYFQSVVAANLASYTGVWYAYEWTDADGDGAPSAGDTFTMIGQGS
ncbi:MAG TPA: hypothetical protein VE987_01790 [Polyangiaceae bacterium]|nr:hypothetical protein [Polyangiaceae bacterium]